jgi:hypothetical protein
MHLSISIPGDGFLVELRSLLCSINPATLAIIYDKPSASSSKHAYTLSVWSDLFSGWHSPSQSIPNGYLVDPTALRDVVQTIGPNPQRSPHPIIHVSFPLTSRSSVLLLVLEFVTAFDKANAVGPLRLSVSDDLFEAVEAYVIRLASAQDGEKMIAAGWLDGEELCL